MPDRQPRSPVKFAREPGLRCKPSNFGLSSHFLQIKSKRCAEVGKLLNLIRFSFHPSRLDEGSSILGIVTHVLSLLVAGSRKELVKMIMIMSSY